VLVKSKKDDRYHVDRVVTHDGLHKAGGLSAVPPMQLDAHIAHIWDTEAAGCDMVAMLCACRPVLAWRRWQSSNSTSAASTRQLRYAHE
jgi:hypothetical protein